MRENVGVVVHSWVSKLKEILPPFLLELARNLIAKSKHHLRKLTPLFAKLQSMLAEQHQKISISEDLHNDPEIMSKLQDEYKYLRRQFRRLKMFLIFLSAMLCIFLLVFFFLQVAHPSTDLANFNFQGQNGGNAGADERKRRWPNDVNDQCIEPRVTWDSNMCFETGSTLFHIKDDDKALRFRAFVKKVNGPIPRDIVPDEFKEHVVDPYWFENPQHSARWTCETNTTSDGLFHVLVDKIPCAKYGCCSLPYILQPETTELRSLYNHFVQNEYLVLKDLVKEPEFILDAGGMGMAPLFFAHIYPKAIIIRVEPHDHNYMSGVNNAHFFPQIKQVHLGLWDKPTVLQMCENTGINWGEGWPFATSRQQAYFTREPRDPPCDVIALDNMRVSTLDRIMAAHDVPRFDIAKMDIEGAEAVALRHKETAQALAKSGVFIAELHDHMREGSSDAAYSVFSKKHGYSSFLFDENLVAVQSKNFKC